MEDPMIRRRNRLPTITVRGDTDESLQPPDVSNAIWKQLQPIISRLPPGWLYGCRPEVSKARETVEKLGLAI
jgi:multidrug efflux pump subunit AcrB